MPDQPSATCTVHVLTLDPQTNRRLPYEQWGECGLPAIGWRSRYREWNDLSRSRDPHEDIVFACELHDAAWDRPLICDSTS